MPDASEVTAISPAAQTNAWVEQKIEDGGRRGTKIICVTADSARFGRHCRGRVRRCKEKEFRGVKMPQLLALLGTVVLPTSDCLSDWAVTISWYMNGDMGWYRAGLSIQLINGLISLFVLVPALDKAFGFKGSFCSARAFLGGLVFGLPGLSPTATAALTLYTQNAAEGARQLKWIKMLEACMEALPQSMLQAYVGISYGKLDPLAEDFSPLLAVSLFLSLFGAGSTLFAAETAARNVNELSPVRISAFSLYGLVSMLARAAEIAACVFWVALTSCAFKGFAAIAIVVIVVFMCFVNVMATSGDDRGSDSMLFFIKAMTWCCLILVAGILWLIFANVEHMDNNYANGSMPVGIAGDAQNYDCHDRTIGFDMAIYSTIAAAILTPVSMCFDPQGGADCCRGRTWQEQLDMDSAGMQPDEVLNAKAEAVFRWANVFQDGVLEPTEIFKVAQQLYPPEEKDFSTRRAFIDARMSRYEELCGGLGVLALSWPQLKGKALLPKDIEAYVATNECFVRFLRDHEDKLTKLFNGLMLPLLPASAGVLGSLCGC